MARAQHTALSLKTFISAIFIPVRASKVDYDIVGCHLKQPLPSKLAWTIAYANDKDTLYIIAQLRTNKEVWEETEIRRVHKD